MRRVLAMAVLSMALGCGKSAPPGPAVCIGDVTITSTAGWEVFAARGCVSVTGTLSITGTEVTSASLPALTKVLGGLSFDNNAALTSISLPVLATVGGALEVDGNTALATVSLPALTSLSGSMKITNNPALPECMALAFADHLAAAQGHFVTSFIYGNDTTATCSVPVVCAGDAVINSSAGMAAFAARRCTSLAGSLEISGTEVTSVSLPTLISVGGNLTVTDATAVISISLPAVTTVGGILHLTGNQALTGLNLPMLTTVDGLQLHYNNALVNLTFPALTRILGRYDFSVTYNTALTSLSFPALATVGGSMLVSGAALGSITMPLLTVVSGDLAVSGTALSSLDFPALTAISVGLYISSNPTLKTFSLPLLGSLGALTITNNATLPQCLALAFKDDQVAAHGYTNIWRISGNDTTAACP